MKINIAYPKMGSQKSFSLEDEKLWSRLIDQRIGGEIDGTVISPEFKGYIFKITGGSDKDGFCMK